ncbi:hypothetical protein BC828DRAFT_150161 [Blastocladiella britannica]|nr:hypothetical protein BC828DRAFT_150161 [Blastocladiella britannica]
MLAYRLRHNLQRMQLRARAITDRFDNSIDMLCQERLSVATDVKAAEIRLMLLYKEWKLLKEFEKHDTILNDKLSQKLSEKAAIDVKIGAIQSKLAEKRVEIEQAVETRKGIESKLSEAIGESSKFEEILGKIFRRRVKRKRRKEALAADGPGSNGEDANGDEEEEEEESDDDEEEDEDEDELVSDDCPAGCDEAMHQAVLDLRERRLDLEESLADVQKGVEALKKDLDIFSKKERVIASALKQTEQEIQEFQSQKQQKLNELDVVVPLSLHQIQFLEDSMESALVFPDDGLAKLRHRILETEEETEQVRKDHKQLKNEHVTLLAVRKEKRNKVLFIAVLGSVKTGTDSVK